MQVDFFLLADHANLTNDGKLNIFGIFDNIRGINFPIKHSEFFVVGKIKPDLNEYGTVHSLTIKLLSGDGITLNQVVGQITLPRPHDGIGSAINFLIRFNDFIFEKPDIYEIGLFIDEVVYSSTPLHVINSR